jgi:hypothetical protein
VHVLKALFLVPAAAMSTAIGIQEGRKQDSIVDELRDDPDFKL